MKKLLVLSFLIMTASVSSALTIGVVNVNKVLSDTKQGKEATSRLERSFKSKKNELKKDEDGIKSAEESYKKQAKILSQEARVKKEQELNQMLVEYQNKTVQYQKEMQKMEADLKKPIIQNLKGIVDEVSKSSGVDFTVEAGTSIIYAANSKNLTDDVIKAYDKKHK